MSLGKTNISNKNWWLLFLDAGLIGSAYSLAFLLHFVFDIPPAYRNFYFVTVVGVVLLKLIVFLLFHVYKVLWRRIGMVDLFNIVRGNVASSICLMGGLLITSRVTGDFVVIVVVDGLVSLFLVAGSRVAMRVIALSIDKKRDFEGVQALGTKQRKIIIIGAGEVGEKILREIRDNGRLQYEVVGFLDDDATKVGLNIHGKSVLGGVDKLEEISKSVGLDEVIIAIGAASGRQMRRIVESCERLRLVSRTIPVVGDILNGQVSVSRFRPVSYEDLLGRPAVALDKKLIEVFLRDEVILVTGGGGSIGSELCRQVGQFQPKHLLICDNSENNLYEIEIDMRQAFPSLSIHQLLVDVRNHSQMAHVFKTYRPNVVIHASAYKHVPMMESHPWEAVQNNVDATRNMLALVEEQNVRGFVLVSTDKAVRPHSIMGATKRVAELLTLAFSAKSTLTNFMIVRFGNVAGSEGSVIPLFKKQIERGGPLTVTHPEITRYFMTIPEAAQLILQAGAMGKGGEIFVLEMGRPLKILDVARDLIRLSGLEPGEEIEIKFTGLRPGEKLNEELVAKGEGIHRTDHEKIIAIRGKACELDWLEKRINELREYSDHHDSEGIQAKLREIVPEYIPYGGDRMSGQKLRKDRDAL